jgi:hypothetical protein
VCATVRIMANRPEALAHIRRPAAALETPETALAVFRKVVLMMRRMMRKRDDNNVLVDND